MPQQDSPRLDWRCRHGAVDATAARLVAAADEVSAQLVALCACETDAESLQRAIVVLRAALSDAEALASHIDCADRHAAEAAG